MFDKIEKQHEKLINIAKEYMNTINDSEHDINHMNDVVEYTKKLYDEEIIKIVTILYDKIYNTK